MRFGIISTAKIAREDVIPGIQRSDHTVAAISSRSRDRASEVAETLGIDGAFGDYETMFAEADIDVVYNPLPNALHAEWSQRAADHGLDVLCEKPLAVDTAEAVDLFDYCAEQGVTLMEAFMYQFHPRTRRAREIVENELGEVHTVDASFKFALSDHEDIRLDPELAGGSLMDVGCYAVSAARGFLGEPDRAFAHARDSRDSGVDTNLSGILSYDDGQVASISCGFDGPRRESYRVEADDGWLEAKDCFGPDHDQSVSLTYSVDGREVTETFEPVDHYQLQVEAFADAIESGETPLVDQAETFGNMRAMDALARSADTGEPVEVASPE
ncbi:Gfo/Idh/MocA family protein [Haloarcula argentinensis]|nr:Gfo/Idh/MocA family oxidoreductase [Haloarcula argentinensis]EMA21006.1 glucose-fructose oxidoreductase [Haloarcula argentinensis DSM 12282]MDS0255190.1 Gfo/Idh/MocA family oxidoreductase [Haloarcula argentinensis]